MREEEARSKIASDVDELPQRLCTHIWNYWTDSYLQLFYRFHTPQIIDITVVSARFEGLKGLEREELLWHCLYSLPVHDRLRMTGCFLLTPEEAHQLAIPKPDQIVFRPHRTKENIA